MRTPRPIAAWTGALRSPGALGHRGACGPMASPHRGGVDAVAGGVADVATR